MKEIKISAQNKTKIEELLRSVNGNASGHTYTDFDEIEHLAKKAEAELDRLMLPKCYRSGARFSSTSGGKTANSYNYSRKATSVILTRKSEWWFLSEVTGEQIGTHGGGRDRIILSKDQSDRLVANFLAQYDVED